MSIMYVLLICKTVLSKCKLIMVSRPFRFRLLQLCRSEAALTGNYPCFCAFLGTYSIRDCAGFMEIAELVIVCEIRQCLQNP